jgi:hypothetical protein
MACTSTVGMRNCRLLSGRRRCAPVVVLGWGTLSRRRGAGLEGGVGSSAELLQQARQRSESGERRREVVEERAHLTDDSGQLLDRGRRRRRTFDHHPLSGLEEGVIGVVMLPDRGR